MTRTKKIEDIKGNQISQNEEGILVNEETGNSLAWDILQLMGKTTRRMIVANIIEGIVILILVAILFFKI
ncbi:MAG TPA: hypothetical protein PLU55_05075 [Candidatus Pacearchaeota archaeon]|nr:hypothetical protein [Candidatus Pacearchaeota archaeon]